MSKKIVILGAGESGTGCAVLAKKLGYEVFVSDYGTISEKYQTELNEIDAEWESNKHTYEKILDADVVIKSPGISNKTEVIKKIKEKNISIISEIEFAFPHTNAKHICITGTNGKTTTTLLTYHIFKKAGLNVGLGGNIGKSYARQVALENYDYYVLELSSFQLDDTYNFRADVAILCNISPDHLDRYDYKIENYINSKFRITQNQTKNDLFIYCFDDEITMQNINKHNIKSHKIPFSYYHKMETGAYIENKKFTLINYNPNQSLSMFLNDFALKGIHNSYNSMAAAIGAQFFNIDKEIIRESLTDFQNVEHRLEFVANHNGVDYINDSKATNVNSTWYALENMDKPIIWIAGGVDKGNDYSALLPLVKEKVKMIICLGTDNTKIHSAFGKHVDLLVNTSSAFECVQVAKTFAQKGDVVLLSPACASFDLFKNYEDRGVQFKQAVKNL